MVCLSINQALNQKYMVIKYFCRAFFNKPLFCYFFKAGLGTHYNNDVFDDSCLVGLFSVSGHASIAVFLHQLTALLLGVYDKSNFIWFSLAYGVSTLIIYRNEFMLIVRKLKWRFSVPLAAFLFIMCIYAVFYALPLVRLDVNSAGSTSLDFQRFNYVRHVLGITLTGSAYTDVLFNTSVDFSNFRNQIAILLYLLSGIFLGFWFIPYYRKRFFSGMESFMKSFLLFYLISVIIFIEMVLIRQATGSHHFIMLMPYTVFITVFCGYTMIEIIQDTIMKKAGVITFYAIAAAILFYNLKTDLWFLQYISNEKNEYSTFWDPAIYELSGYIQNTGIRNVYSLDWGLHNQLHAFDPERDRKNYYDLIWYFNDYNNKTENEKEWYFDTFFDKAEILFVGHGSETTNLVNASEGFEAFAKESLTGGVLEKMHSIPNNQGLVLYQVFKYTKNR